MMSVAVPPLKRILRSNAILNENDPFQELWQWVVLFNKNHGD